MVSVILLDLDDTLLDFRKAEKIAVRSTLEHFGAPSDEHILRRYSELNLAQWKLLELGRLTRDEVKLRRFVLLINEFGLDIEPAAAARYYENALSIGHYFIDGAPELLESLHEKYALYLVSNGTAAVQEGRLKSAGIKKYFKDIFISQYIGAEKPDRAFFDRCFARIADFKRDETVIVGDSLSSDIKGGKNAGIGTVWFNPRHEAPGDPTPDYEIHRLCELEALLEQI